MVRSRAISIGDGHVLSDPIETIIAGTYRREESGEIFPCPIKSLHIEADLTGQGKDLVKGLDITGRYALVCDPNTFDALGARLSRELMFAETIIIDAPKADEEHVESLMDQTRHVDTLIAVGAGTLNDLCKYVSHRRGRPYLVFPTAPSMNGYTTATASISRGGEKLSLPAAPAKGVFFDLGVLANAPARLINAGIGDSLCRSTAQVDWLLSHYLLDTRYLAAPFALQADAERDLLDHVGKLHDGDLHAMRALVRLLILGGLGMLIAGNSQPGSQGEHLISHYIDMFCRPHPETLHGEQVGLATWTMARLQHDILQSTSPPILGETAIDARSMKARYGTLSPAFQKAIQAKAISGPDVDLMNEKLAVIWPMLRKDLNAIALSPDDLSTAFNASGVIQEAERLGIDRFFYCDAVRHARELRDRYTMLDFAADADRLDPFIEHLCT